MWDIFSKRHNTKKPIFTYNNIPDSFRVQIIHILDGSIGKYGYINRGRGYGYREDGAANHLWEMIHDVLCREYGVFSLGKGDNPYEKCRAFILLERSVEKILDIIEISFRVVDRVIRENRGNSTQDPDDAISELNYRFQEHGLGYQFISGSIVRVDSNYIFKEAVEPAVNLLFSENFEGASEEFMRAHEHFRKGNDKEAVTEALKAFESVMKTIIQRMEWELPAKENANALIKTLVENGLLPNWLENSLIGLANLRNKLTAHGQGEKAIAIPRYTVAYALHLCASNIVFLIDSYKQLENLDTNFDTNV